MALVLDRNFAGTVGASYANADDPDFDNVAGTAPTYQATANAGVSALRFAAGGQSIVGETFTGTTVRTISRIWKLSATPASNGEVLQVRSAGARGPGVIITTDGKVILTNVNGSSLRTSDTTVPIGAEFRVTLRVSGNQFGFDIYPDTTATTPQETLSATGSGSVTMVTVRDGHLTSTGLGAGVTLDVSWPRDESTTTDPGPRTYLTVSTVTGQLPAAAGLSGSAVTVHTAAGQLPATAVLGSTSATVHAASGSLPATTTVGAAATTVHSAAGGLPAAVALTGAAVTVHTRTGQLPAAVAVSAASGTVHTTTGQLPAQIQLIGATVSATTVTGGLPATVGLSAQAVTVHQATGQLPSTVEVSAASVTVHVATGALPADITASAEALTIHTATGQLPAEVTITGDATTLGPITRDLTFTAALGDPSWAAVLGGNAWSAAIGVPSWSAQIGDPVKITTVSEEFVPARFSSTDANGSPAVVFDTQLVQLAVVAADEVPELADFHTAEWVGTPSRTRWARLLVGPGTDIPLTAGEYRVFGRVVDTTEKAVRPAGTLTVT